MSCTHICISIYLIELSRSHIYSDSFWGQFPEKEITVLLQRPVVCLYCSIHPSLQQICMTKGWNTKSMRQTHSCCLVKWSSFVLILMLKLNWMLDEFLSWGHQETSWSDTRSFSFFIHPFLLCSFDLKHFVSCFCLLLVLMSLLPQAILSCQWFPLPIQALSELNQKNRRAHMSSVKEKHTREERREKNQILVLSRKREPEAHILWTRNKISWKKDWHKRQGIEKTHWVSFDCTRALSFHLRSLMISFNGQ